LEHADVVDHGLDPRQQLRSRIAKVDKSVELAGTGIGVEAQKPGGAWGERDLRRGRDEGRV